MNLCCHVTIYSLYKVPATSYRKGRHKKRAKVRRETINMKVEWSETWLCVFAKHWTDLCVTPKPFAMSTAHSPMSHDTGKLFKLPFLLLSWSDGVPEAVMCAQQWGQLHQCFIVSRESCDSVQLPLVVDWCRNWSQCWSVSVLVAVGISIGCRSILESVLVSVSQSVLMDVDVAIGFGRSCSRSLILNFRIFQASGTLTVHHRYMISWRFWSGRQSTRCQ